MELYTLDNQFRRITVFDQFKSLIWTERYKTAGDFQMEIASDRNAREYLSAGTYVTVDNTNRVCQIETVEDVVSSRGEKVLKVSGRGIEATILNDRIATLGTESLTATPKFEMTDLPAVVARRIFHAICVQKINSPADGIPFLAGETLITRRNLHINPRVLSSPANGWQSSAAITTTVVNGKTWVNVPTGLFYTYARVNGVQGRYYAASIRVRGPIGAGFRMQNTDSSVGEWGVSESYVIPSSGEIVVKIRSLTAIASTNVMFGLYGETESGFMLTDVLVEEVPGPGYLPYGDFFDGATPGASWVGTPNESQSTTLGVTGGIYEHGTIPEPQEVVSFSLDIDTVYVTIAKICAMYNLGLRLARNGDTSYLYFDIYTGDDRTTLQTVRPAVVFSPELDNLSETSELMSVALQKTVALVMAPNGSAWVYADGWDDSSAVGFNRRVLFVKADDIDLPAGTALQNALIQRGKEALSEHQIVYAFDGEIPSFGSYEYGPGKDYDLGDIVEQRNSDGVSNNMRVDEHIRVSDATGEKAYPTLVSELLITPGTWLAWDASQYWNDALGYWEDA